MKYDEGRLWSAVIIQAIQDLLGKNQKLRKEAQGWINSQSFAMVCDLANLDFEWTKNALNKIGTNKEGLIDFSSSETQSSLVHNKEAAALFVGQYLNDCLSMPEERKSILQWTLANA